MPQPSTTRNAIKKLISDLGPLTAAEIAEELGMTLKAISSCLSTSRTGKRKHFYIVDHRPQVGVSGLPAGIYAVGNRKDAAPPPCDKKGTAARYYQNHKATIKLKRTTRKAGPFTSLIVQVAK
ncbi:hypothetical protein DF105_01070 [Burkholderia stagnalis]|uniref:hypothetical protein n=1 Tax=Burkholderia stagnalis TaxID=1503054 RepID=UPI000F5EEF1C|nr:hypothetical protein [Burkholderia stagnalis]RQZ08924.1 hypothetical protein DF105_01070 [Burkholderia stagnalis]